MKPLTFHQIASAVHAEADGPTVSPVELVNILSRLLLPEEPVIEGPPEEIGTGLYRMADGQVVGNEPEPRQF